MNLQIENLEKNMVKITAELPVEEVEKAIQDAYLKNRSKISVPGFRKGKVPRQMIEKMHGPEIFYEDAANEMINHSYPDVAEESGLDIVSQPHIHVVQIEKGKPFIFTAEVAVKPEVVLGTYKGVEISKHSVEVSDEEVNADIDKAREQNARIVPAGDRGIMDQDIAVIDFEGYLDGVPFEGGKGTDHSLTIGSHSFIDTFEDQLIGKNVGDKVEVNVTFPEDYHSEDLKGKPVVFQVTIKDIKVKELPELDDEFVSESTDFETVEEYKSDIRTKLLEKKEKEATSAKEEEVIAKIVEDSEMEIPEPMIDSQVRQMAEDFARRLQQQGMALEQYFQYTGMNAETFVAQMRPQAVNRIESRLVLEAITKAENIEASEAEVELELTNMAAMYQMETDKLKEVMGESEQKQLRLDIAVQKAVNLVVAESKEV